MAAAEPETAKRSYDDDFAPRKRFKVSELPLNSNQRSTIDSLLHTIKKKGEYDALRKRVWAQYLESEDKVAFTSSLNDLAEVEIERDPSLLSRERGKAATLMQGAVDRSNIYKSVELSLDALIAQHVGVVENVARDIRRSEIGEEAAAEEERHGNKPDEEYMAEANTRREARQKQKEKEEARKRREKEVEKLRAEEAKKKAELDKLRKADERRREHQAREEKRAKDREAHRALLKRNEQEEQLRREDRRKEESKRREGRDRSSDRLRPERDPEGTPRSREPTRHDSHTPLEENSATPPPASPLDEKAIEDKALEALLQEGRELADKSTSRVKPGRPASIEPPSLRKSQSVKPPKLAEPSPPKGPSVDRSHSPHKAIVIPTGPKLSYSQTRRPPASPPPDRGPRSPSRSDTRYRRESIDDRHKSYDPHPRYSVGRHESSKYDAREDECAKPRSHRDEERRAYPESRRISSRHADYGREREYEQDREQEKDRSTNREHDEDRYSSSRGYDYEKENNRSSRDYYDSEKYRSSRDYGYEKEKYRSSRDYEYEKEKDRSTRHRSHGRDQGRRYGRSERSRSGERASYHHRPTGSTGVIQSRSYRQGDRPGDRPRPKSPIEIDRYVPSTSSRAKELEPRGFHRDRSKFGLDGAEDVEGKDSERERYADKDRYAEKEKYSEKERGRDRDRDRERERERDKDRDRYLEKEREKKPFVEIDRYVPGGGDKGRERERDKDRERDREREGARDREKHREGDREREGGRERERDRDRERDRERERGRERSR